MASPKILVLLAFFGFSAASVQAACPQTQAPSNVKSLTRQLFICLKPEVQASYFNKEDRLIERLPLATAAKRGLVQTPSFNTQMTRILNDEQALWSDTVLEGEVAMTGKIQASNITLLAINRQIFGFEVTMSADAVGTYDDNCKQLKNGTWSDACSRGTISVTKLYDFRFRLIDTGDVAEFND